MIGLIGRKVGMTRVFTEEGVSIPVTVVRIPLARAHDEHDRRGPGS